MDRRGSKRENRQENDKNLLFFSLGCAFHSALCVHSYDNFDNNNIIKLVLHSTVFQTKIFNA